MSNSLKEKLAGLSGSVSTFVISSALLAVSPATAFAQDGGTAADDEEIEQVVVTGSRIRRDEFSSAAPLQRIDASAARKMGIFSIADMLQQTSLANGNQIDATINTNAGNSNASEAPPAGGVGSSNIDLRGLGPERTLVLINGRRLGASGVRGAPSQPDLSMIPMAMVERVEMITEGASSVYGADAVAGVANIILRNDFEGMEVNALYSDPSGAGGAEKGISFIAGMAGDKARFSIAADYFDRKRVSARQRGRTCIETLEVDEATGDTIGGCRNGFFDNVILAAGNTMAGGEAWILATPGSTNIGVPGFSDYQALSGPSSSDLRSRSLDGAGWRDFGFQCYYSDCDQRLDSDLIAPTTRMSVLALGSYDISDTSQFYTEISYNSRHMNSKATTEQIFATFPGMIPEEDANGNIIVDGTGAPILVDNPWNPFDADFIPIVTLDDIPQDRHVEVQNFRIVTGLKGDITSDLMEDNNWSYDIYASYDRGTGFQSQQVLNEGNFALALGTMRLDADGNVICGHSVGDGFGFFSPETCVPVNLAAPSIYADGDGRFSSDAEREFLLGNRTNRTVTEQYNAQAFMTGDLFEVLNSGSKASAAFGLEYRKDKISSQNSRDGVVADIGAENPLPEGETIGERELKEAFAELNVPLMVNGGMGDYLGIEAAVRFTDESNFGSATTERLRLTYRPNSYIQMSGSYGTSFRAPNMREQFLASQGGGIGGGADPCRANDYTDGGGNYVPALDTRTDRLINNCILAGADPTTLGLNGTVTIPTSAGGNAELLAETSRSYTATVQLSQPWWEEFDFSVAVSYYDIKINDTVRESDPVSIINECYNNADNLADPACARVVRNPIGGFINNVDASFINIGLERAKGYDLNTRLGFTIDDFGSETLNFGWSTTTSFTTMRQRQTEPDSPMVLLKGSAGYPKVRINSTVSMNIESVTLLWTTQYTGKTDGQTPDKFTGFRNNPYLQSESSYPLYALPSAWYHNMSVNYEMDSAAITVGVKNVFDKLAPLVGGGDRRANFTTTSGYHLNGRTLYFNLTKRF